MALSDSRRGRRSRSSVEAATLAHDGSPPITRITFPACRAHYPGGPNGCSCRFLPRPRGLPRYAGGSASAPSLSRPAQASLTLWPIGLLSRPRRLSSRGFDPAGCPTKSLVSYQINRQFSGWILPPLVTRAFGAHVESRKSAVAWAMRQRSVSLPRSSNRTCRFPASGFPTGFIMRHTASVQHARVEGATHRASRIQHHRGTALCRVLSRCAVC
jgi:hypothetical protein